MASMCGEGEKTCPLCAEEMDLTDQQLKPCQCGYQICVWCWHHIMDMAEKDETEGRCPACRTPYDKEKIVGMAANCERMMAGISTEKKIKSQKAKSKASEGRKQLSSVRVIQRNLVYVVGLPLDLADEDVLQHKEYFGQYGKVLKVSMSRTSSGVIQQFPNNTCSVYITYSKEEEAIRCIQSVHGFTLNGRPLRACFGTTKYCHAWLRNVPCSNPDCLYLHEIGSPEDSFTKDEIISAYTRSRVQQITSNMNTMQRRSGDVLPPPFDDYSISSSATPGKPIVKNASNITASMVKGSPPNGITGRTVALPAAASWGMRASNCSSQAAGLDSVKGTLKPRSETFVAASGQADNSNNNVAGKPLLPLSNDNHNILSNSKVETSSLKQHQVMASDASSLDKCVQLGEHTTTVKSDRLSGVLNKKMPPDDVNSLSNSEDTNSPCVESNMNIRKDAEIEELCSDLLSLNIDKNHGWKNTAQPESLQKQSSCQKEPVVSMVVQKYVSSNEVRLSSEKMQMADSEAEQDILSFDNQRLKDPEVVNRSNYLSNLTSPLHVPDQFTSHSFQHHEMMNLNGVKADHSFVNNTSTDNSLFHASMGPIIGNGYSEHSAVHASGLERIAKGSFVLPHESNSMQNGLCQNDLANAKRNGFSDLGESSIISNILSWDFDPWNDSLTSPENIAKFFDKKDNQQVSLKSSSYWKLQNNSQSRFSFARQEELKCQSNDTAVLFSNLGQPSGNRSVDEDLSTQRDLFLPSVGIGNGFPFQNYEETGNFTGSQFQLSSSRTVSRSQVSAPPGFSVPSKAPPPGFSSQERRLDQAFEKSSGNHLLEMHTLSPSSYQVQPTGNFGSLSDVEFMDPAILAVGKGRINSGFDSSGLDFRSLLQQRHAFEGEPGLELLMQRSLSLHQNPRYDIGADYSSLNDSCATSSRILDQSQIGSRSPFAQLSLQQGRSVLTSNGHWNDIQVGNGLNAAGLLQNKQLGMDKFYNGFEDSKFRMPSSADLYNRTFGM